MVSAARAGWPKRAPHMDDSVSKECFDKLLSHLIRPSDVFVLTAPKTGTTFLQQICHQLRTGGHMAFEDIYQVAPWPQMAWDVGLDVDQDQMAYPRLYKSHQLLSAASLVPKYIVTVRDPAQTVISWYQFLKNKNVPPVLAHVDVNSFVFDKDFFAEGMRFGGTLWDYYIEFWEAREDPAVLVLVFEALVADLRGHLPCIATHMGLPVPSLAGMERVAETCSRSNMMKHGHKFDESWAYAEAKRIGRSPNPESWAPAARVTQGHSSTLDAKALAFLDEQWRARVQPRTGHASYAEMAAAFNAHLLQKL